MQKETGEQHWLMVLERSICQICNLSFLDMEIVVNCPQFANKSFKILHLNNPLRRLCIRIVLNPYVVIFSECFDFSLKFSWFERITMIVILINCITLGMYKPCADSTTCNRKCFLLKVYPKITMKSWLF